MDIVVIEATEITSDGGVVPGAAGGIIQEVVDVCCWETFLFLPPVFFLGSFSDYLITLSRHTLLALADRSVTQSPFFSVYAQTLSRLHAQYFGLLLLSTCRRWLTR